MKKSICLKQSDVRLSIVKYSIGLFLLFTGTFSDANSQAIQTPASEEQRRRSQLEAAERVRQLQSPNVVLPTAVATGSLADIHSLTLPDESPCFQMNQFELVVPLQLSPAAHVAGASQLAFDPFRFAQNYLNQYSGQCIGQQGLNVIVQRLTNLIMQNGYSTTRIGIPEQDLSAGTLTLT